MMKLRQLAERCKGEVSIEVNPHRNCYETVDYWMKDWFGEGHGGMGAMEALSSEVAADVFAEMIKRDTIVKVQFYSLTPVSFMVVFHWDVEAAMDDALAMLAAEKSP